MQCDLRTEAVSSGTTLRQDKSGFRTGEGRKRSAFWFTGLVGIMGGRSKGGGKGVIGLKLKSTTVARKIEERKNRQRQQGRRRVIEIVESIAADLELERRKGGSLHQFCQWMRV